MEWQAVRAQASGLVTRVSVVEGGGIANGGVLAVMSDPALDAEIDTAQAKVSEAEANVASLEAGLRPAELTEIDNGLARGQPGIAAGRTRTGSVAAAGRQTGRHHHGGDRGA